MLDRGPVVHVGEFQTPIFLSLLVNPLTGYSASLEAFVALTFVCQFLWGKWEVSVVMLW
jgi:hypothetical protein